MTIFLKDIMPIENLNDYKIHLAKMENGNEPLDAFLNGNWIDWQVKKKNNRFNRKYIMTFAKIYSRPNAFLFTGIYEVLGDNPNDSSKYSVAETNIYSIYVGRLIVSIFNKDKSPYKSRSTALLLKNYFNDIEVVEILEKKFEEVDFPGFDSIDIDFFNLKNIILRKSKQWKSPLNNVQGIYLLTDKKTNKRYVGSATGAEGIWQRWEQYTKTCHAGNKKLKELLNKNNNEYFYDNFMFSLLETYPKNSKSTNAILARESYWKNVMLSRDKKFGYNDN